MDDLQFEELVQYVSDHIEHDLDRYASRQMDEMREPLYSACSELSDAIDSLAEEWCEDNGFDANDYYDYYNSEDVFMHTKYAFDA